MQDHEVARAAGSADPGATRATPSTTSTADASRSSERRQRHSSHEEGPPPPTVPKDPWIRKALFGVVTAVIGGVIIFGITRWWGQPPPPVPPEVATRTNVDLIAGASEVYGHVGNGRDQTLDPFLKEIEHRFFDKALKAPAKPLCVNDPALWGTRTSPNAMWYVVAPSLNGHLAQAGLRYPPDGTWTAEVPPGACSGEV